MKPAAPVTAYRTGAQRRQRPRWSAADDDYPRLATVSGPNEPIRILRVIARLNMGGPALHVTYLTQGLASRGYATTLLAGEVSRGEDSMAYVAEQAGVSF